MVKPVYGLYLPFVSSIVYIFFGTGRHLSVGEYRRKIFRLMKDLLMTNIWPNFVRCDNDCVFVICYAKILCFYFFTIHHIDHGGGVIYLCGFSLRGYSRTVEDSY